MEGELLRLHVEHGGAEHVAGHEVGRELHAAEAGINQTGNQLGQQRLGYAGHALDEHMAVGQDGGQDEFYGFLLAHDDLGNLVAQLLDALRELREVRAGG